MSEQVLELLEDIKTNKPGAFDKFFSLVEGRVLSFGMKVCGETEDAKDTLQETLMSAFKTLPALEFNDQKALNVWLYKVAKNSCLMMRRKSKFSPEREISLEQITREEKSPVQIPDRSSLQDDQLLKKELSEMVRRAVHSIPQHYRLALVLRDMEQLTTKEVAAILEISEQNVKIRVHRARQQLRKALDRKFAAYPDLAELCRGAGPANPCRAIFSPEEIAKFKAAYEQAANRRGKITEQTE